MEFIVISVTAFLVAILSFFSGFGLGTILTPVFMIFFPVDLAIGLTGLVHFFNNIFKLFLVGRQVDKYVLLNFGIPAVLAAMLGSWLLIQLSGLPTLFSYHLFGRFIEVSVVKFVISILLIVFACMDLIPYFSQLKFDKKMLPFGGMLSGFFGGLSGNQGALRTAFLIKSGISKEAFISTAVVISTFVDCTRLSIYASRFSNLALGDHLLLLVCASGSAMFGAFLGNKWLKKVSYSFLRITVAIFLILVSIALGMGMI